MKHKMIVFCLFLLLAAQMTILPVKASNSGYYYEHIDVQVDVNEKREFLITETLDVFYEEQMHGIIRTIPNFSRAEKYEITDISVVGAPFLVEEQIDGVSIRIGDADRYVQGSQRYILTYTLKHYQDYDSNHDYIYLNLIGNDFDCVTKHLTATIHWPNEGLLENCTLTSGFEGSTENSKFHYQIMEHGVSIESKRLVEPYEAATIQLQFQEGVFNQAPVYKYPYIVNQQDIFIEIDKKQDFYVKQKIHLTQKRDIINYPMNLLFDMEAFHISEIKDLQCKIDGKECSSSYLINIHEAKEHTIELQYRIHPKKILDGIFDFQLVDGTEDTSIEQLHLKVKMPQLMNASVHVGRWNDSNDSSRYTLDIQDQTLELQTQTTLQSAEEVTVTLLFNEHHFYRPTPILINFLPIASMILLAGVILYRIFGLKNHFVELVSFYPPKGMNPAEVGYLIDRKCSNDDLTSLIFYWADLQALKIKGLKKDFTLVKTNDLPVSCPNYEQTLFQAMFRYGTNHEVTMKQLKNKFYYDIQVAKRAISSRYQDKMYDPQVKRYRNIVFALAMLIWVMMMTVMCVYDANNQGISYLYFIAFSPMLLVSLIIVIITVILRKRKLSQTTKILFFCFIAIPLLILSLLEIIVIDLYQKQFFIVMLCCLFASIIASGFKKYTEEMETQIGELRGFKNFIRYAKKEELELLLEDDPEYYYHILPYAQVLHVTKIWTNKFKAIAIPPASYTEGVKMDINDFHSFTRTVTHSMSKSMKAPASVSSDNSSSSSGGYSGSSGGFSSGGSSGGGSGGGGSRGW
ncbi:MAG: DUF2207 domain-containing protein [Erysipelotrichaceae bacterium]|nr:DUF2207 domain-containing protein [Erysipelotrichaceae bacterium]